MEKENEPAQFEIEKLRKTIELVIAANNCLAHMSVESNEVQEILKSLCVNYDSLKQHCLVMNMRDISDINTNINSVRTGLYDTISRLTELYAELTRSEYFTDVKKIVKKSVEKVVEDMSKAFKPTENRTVMKSEHKVNLVNPSENVNLANALEYFSEHFSGKDKENKFVKIKKPRKKKGDNE